MTRDDFDAACRALPAVSMVVQWGDSQVYKVADKVFCWLGPADTVTLKVSEIVYHALTESGVGGKAQYTQAGTGWLGLPSLTSLPDDQLTGLLADAHAMIAAKLTKAKRMAAGLAP